MANKIAAPRKTAPKTPARKKAVSKKVTAPLRHKPKGSPKEKLAYLNKGEMAALVKKKGSPARKGPKGLPSFADDSASSKGVSRGDTYGTKGSGSTKTATGSVSKSSESRSSPSGAGPGRGQGGQGGYNSGVSGSRYGGVSTQKPGMGRNAGRVGPQSPMAGQGASFKTPANASLYNKGPALGIEDQRGIQNMPQRPYFDNGRIVNPNVPEPDYDKMNRDYLASMEAKRRQQARDLYGDEYTTPREIREQVGRYQRRGNEYNAQRAREGMELEGDFRSRMPDSAFSNSNRINSSRTPDIKVGGGPRSGSTGLGSSGGGRGGGGGRGFKSGGIVKPKTFKKK